MADEPVSCLDASVRGEILALMLGLVRETGVAILVVTHDLGLAWNIADRVAVMYLGRIVEEGTTEEMLAAPHHPYTRALLSVVPEDAHVEQQILTGEAPDPTQIPAAAASTPAARSSASARRRGWASRSAAAGRTSRWRRCPARPPGRGVPRGGRGRRARGCGRVIGTRAGEVAAASIAATRCRSRGTATPRCSRSSAG